MRHVATLVIGQGIAGSAVAWTLLLRDEDVLVVDRPVGETPSRVAAGLVTPVTGKHLARSRDYDDLFDAAAGFYRSVADILGRPLFEKRPSVRVLDESGVDAVLNRPKMPGVRRWAGRLQDGGPVFNGFGMTPAARLDVATYLEETRRHFRDRGRFVEADLKPSQIDHGEKAVRIPQLELSADRVVYCTGVAETPPFSGVPNDPARGDILHVRIPDYAAESVVHFGHWIVPEADGTQLVGASFDWKPPSAEATAAGRERILRSLRSVVRGPVEVLGVRSSVRPTMRDHRPVVGRHPSVPRAYVLNGLGAKGVLRAPAMASRLYAALRREADPPPRLRYDRLVTPIERPRPLTAVAHDAVRGVVRPGETVIDATVGNGHDTVFLAEAVGPSGRVAGFDVQRAAVEGTRRRLAAAGLENVRLHHESHDRIADRVDGPIAAAMFNLGYLPRGDHAVVTKPESTITALRYALGLLRPGGVSTVLCYRGHGGGREEAEAVEAELRSLPPRFGLVVRKAASSPETAPVLFIVEHRGDS